MRHYNLKVLIGQKTPAVFRAVSSRTDFNLAENIQFCFSSFLREMKAL